MIKRLQTKLRRLAAFGVRRPDAALLSMRLDQDQSGAMQPYSKKAFASIVALFLLMGCNVRLPGKPTEAERWRAPADVSDFTELYTQNCAGCHGGDGKLGAARSLNDSLYLSFIPDDALKQVISQGRNGTNMPAFSQQAGGTLTDRQIELLVSGMRAAWAKPDDIKGVPLPSYSASGSGSTASGAHAYQTYCESCHGTNGDGGKAGSIVDPNFLNMVSDQGLRTTVVVGRADLGKPDWRGNVPGQPMSAQEIADVVAWLAAHRQMTAVVANRQPSGLPEK